MRLISKFVISKIIDPSPLSASPITLTEAEGVR